jgi:hypothetical protein
VSTTTDRAGYIAGLRALADVLERHADLPLPSYGTAEYSPIYLAFFGAYAREELAAAARVMPCRLDKDATEKWFNLDGWLHGLRIQLTAVRDAVCERVVLGTETVVTTVPDPAVEVPLVEVTEQREIVEWRCGPLLAEASR